MKIKLLASVLVLIGIAGCNDSGTSAVDTKPQSPTSYEQGLKNVQEMMLAKEGERGNAIYQDFFAQIHADAKNYADTIEFDKDSEMWPDLPAANTAAGGNEMHFSVNRLKTMSQAYITPGPLYLNAELLEKIKRGLDVFLTRLYPVEYKQDGFWYEWQIGAPQSLMNILANLEGYIGETLKRRVLDSVDTYVTSIDDVNDYSRKYGLKGLSTGANRVDQAWAMLVRGFVKQQSADIEAAKLAFADSIYNRYADFKTESGSSGAYRNGVIDSFRKDNSYIFHVDLPYSNGYGLDLLNRAAEMLILLNGTEFDFSQQEKDVILHDAFDRVTNAYMPWLKDGLGLDPTAGRAVFRGFEQNHGKGHWAIEGILKYYQLADYGSDPVVNAQRKKAIGTFAKAFLNNDSEYYARYGSEHDATQAHEIEEYATEAISIRLAKTIIADSSIATVKEPLLGNRMFPEMDRVIHRTEKFSFAISAHSYRIGNFEIIGGEGTRGCYSADGMTYIYDDDLEQYMNYWVAFDADHPAGVTNDGISPTAPNECSWSTNHTQYPQRKADLRWTGGVSAGSEGFGIYGMDYKDWNWVPGASSATRAEAPHVEAKKSWFMFSDTIMALGSDIKCNAGCNWANVETTIDNRKLNASGSNDIVVNGESWQGQPTIANVTSMHVEGNVSSSQLGIVFPKARQVSLAKEFLSGDWTLLASRASKLMDKPFVQAYFLRTSVAHPSSAENSYAYVLLPGKSVAETENYAKNPTLAILNNDADFHAVHNTLTNVYAMNVFAAPSDSYRDASANLLLEHFIANGNKNSSLPGDIADQLLSLAESEKFYGDGQFVKSTGGVSLMSRLVGDELTLWISQPTRNVMSAVIDVTDSGYRLAEIVNDSGHVALNSDGSKAVVSFDLLLTFGTEAAFEAEGATYKLTFKVVPN
ncbi:Hyaluronate lyase precursor [Campylobacter jejuni]|nr:Hyaluronate lyase precursor [Campylobacter jejuni]